MRVYVVTMLTHVDTCVAKTEYNNLIIIIIIMLIFLPVVNLVPAIRIYLHTQGVS
jgi:hypothetical protein